MEITRYPKTENKSLKAFNAADELLIEFIGGNTSKNIIIYNDRFGYLGCSLADLDPTNVLFYKSQEKSLLQNIYKNKLTTPSTYYIFDEQQDFFELGLVKIPKSLELFEFVLIHLKKYLSQNGIVACGFMTRYFSKKILEVASKHFESVEQSMAKKKARVLILTKPKQNLATNCLKELKYNDTVFKQYYGTFSAKNIDFASQFFVENWQLNNENKVLDLASGNGFLAWNIQQKIPNSEIHLMDDSSLAVESSKLNLKGKQINFHLNDVLDNFEENSFDLIVSNPPFHIEFENNIEIAINLFKGAKRILNPTGNFQLVASKHLNFKTHLEQLFSVVTIADNGKFVVYKCVTK